MTLLAILAHHGFHPDHVGLYLGVGLLIGLPLGAAYVRYDYREGVDLPPGFAVLLVAASWPFVLFVLCGICAAAAAQRAAYGLDRRLPRRRSRASLEARITELEREVEL